MFSFLTSTLQKIGLLAKPVENLFENLAAHLLTPAHITQIGAEIEKGVLAGLDYVTHRNAISQTIMGLLGANAEQSVADMLAAGAIGVLNNSMSKVAASQAASGTTTAAQVAAAITGTGTPAPAAPATVA